MWRNPFYWNRNSWKVWTGHSLLNFTDDVPRLFGTNFDSAYVNQEMLEELEGDIFVFKAKDEGKLLSA